MNELQVADRVAVVPYSTTACVASALIANQREVVEVVAGLTSRLDGYTNIGAGIKLSHMELITSTRYVPETAKMIILLSDGNANRPEGVAEEYALREAGAAAANKITIYTIGLGVDANAVLLENIGMCTDGRYYFAPNGSSLEGIFQAIISEF